MLSRYTSYWKHNGRFAQNRPPNFTFVFQRLSSFNCTFRNLEVLNPFTKLWNMKKQQQHMSLCPPRYWNPIKKTAANWEHVHLLLQGGDEKFVQTSRDLLLGRYVSPTLCCLYRLVQEIQNSAKSSTTGLYLCVSETFKYQLQIPKLEYLSSFTEVWNMKKQQEQQSLRTDIETQQKKAFQEIICSLVQSGDEKFTQTSRDLLSGKNVSPMFMLSVKATTGNTTLGR